MKDLRGSITLSSLHETVFFKDTSVRQKDMVSMFMCLVWMKIGREEIPELNRYLFQLNKLSWCFFLSSNNCVYEYTIGRRAEDSNSSS